MPRIQDLRTALARLLGGATIALVTVVEPSAAQTDSARGAEAGGLHVAIDGGIYYHEYRNQSFSAPEGLGRRRRDNPVLAERWQLTGDQIADAPLYHGASWVDVRLTAEPIHGCKAIADFIGESLGTSYGTFNSHNLAVIPLMRVGIDTAITIGPIDWPVRLPSFSLRTTIEAGHFSDMRLGEGLMIYNIDGEGSRFGLAVGPASARYTRIGDLSFGIGLGIDEVYDTHVGVDDLPIADRLRIGAHLGYSQMQYAPTHQDYPEKSPRRQLLDAVGLSDQIVTADLSVAFDSLRLYAEAGRRSASGTMHGMARSAIVTGLEGSWKAGPLTIAGRGEYRSYGGLFNHGYRNTNVYYRDTALGSYGNNIGPQIYPLPYFERPFSQWAVATEYQDLRFVDIATLDASATLELPWDLRARIGVDANDVMAEREKPFLYLFYNAGIGWEPSHGLSVSMSLTNKEMNLDKHYMTFYMMRSATLELAVRFRY